MPNAIKTTLKIEYLEDNLVRRSVPTRVFGVETTSNILSDNTQLVGTSHAAIDIGDVTDDAMMIIENLHATATVQVGGDDSAVFVPWIDIPAGGPPAIIPIVTALADTYLQSSVASTPVRVTMIKVVAPT